MSIETYLSLGALIVAIVGAIVSSRKSSADIAKTKLETEKLLREMLNDETLKRKALEGQVESLESSVRHANELIVTLEGQLRERDDLVEDFRDYVGKLVVIMRAARLDVPEFLPRRGQKQ